MLTLAQPKSAHQNTNSEFFWWQEFLQYIISFTLLKNFCEEKTILCLFIFGEYW